MTLMFEWMGYERLNPFTLRRGDFQAALVARTMANIWRGRNQQPYEITDFMPQWGYREPKTAGELYQIIKTTLFLGPGIVDKREQNA